jgi:DNA-binding response OmpR family regulator
VKILLADDRKELIEPLQDFLSRRGHEVDMVFDGTAAKEMLSKTTYDLALLDLSMPEVTGIELVEHVKRVSPSTKTVIITAYPLLREFLIDQVGADDFLSKPFAYEDVEALVRRLGGPAK